MVILMDGNFGYNYGGTISWISGNNGLMEVISAATPMVSGQTLDINPYNGTYMARLDNLEGNYHAAKISQTATISSEDLGDTLYVNWGAMLVEHSNTHPADAYPYFGISVKKNGTIISSFSADATDHDAGWMIGGYAYGDAWYKAETWKFILGSEFALGYNITIELYVADCSWGGHGGMAFLDGIGTEYQPPNGVAEPNILSMIIIGMFSIVGSLRFFRFKK